MMISADDGATGAGGLDHAILACRIAQHDGFLG